MYMKYTDVFLFIFFIPLLLLHSKRKTGESWFSSFSHLKQVHPHAEHVPEARANSLERNFSWIILCHSQGLIRFEGMFVNS